MVAMPSSPCTMQRGTSFSLNVTLGYGADNKAEDELNKACSKHTFGFTEMASSFFSGSSTSAAAAAAASSLYTSGSDIWGNSKSDNNHNDQDRFFVASASHVRLCVNPSEEKFWKTNNAHNLIVVFLPPHMIASALETHFSSNKVASGSSFWINRPASGNFVNDLLPKIHPTALKGCRIRGIVLTTIAASNGPAELLILEVPKGRSIQDDILQVTNGCTIAGDSESGILKILPLATIEFTHVEEEDGGKDDDLYSEKKMMGQQSIRSSNSSKFSMSGSSSGSSSATIPSTVTETLPIPTCPVCIHRIDPIRFGLPGPCVQQLCSKFCQSPSLIVGSWGAEEETCHKQRLLKKWALPARCKACQVINHYWNYSNSKYGEDEEDRDLFCGECSMHKTLWTCLTCGFVGCGRYSNKHSVAHFEQTRHPYSLELATLRIWDYCHGEYGGFVQRADLLECPSSPPLLYPWLIRGLDSDDHSESVSALHRSPYNDLSDALAHSSTANAAFSKATEKPSKKVMMIGEEYEALLQSALEDQAQHYEDEITRLRAKLTNSLVDRDSMIPEEAKEIEEIQIEIKIIRESIGNTSKELIEAQAQEVELRAASGRLLSQQKESNELLKTIQEEHRRENEEGKLQIEDLELQIADLKSNLMMRQQISQNNELANAQIFGTTSAPDSRNSGGRKGKKKGRFFRK